jgi:SAM-dependent methyltransferase
MDDLAQPAANHTVLFDWDLSQFDRLVENCAYDDSIALGLSYLPRDGRIIEAGCGPGHVVAFLAAQGFNIEGVELNASVVAAMRQQKPCLPLRVGDVSQLDVPPGHYRGLLSLGVVEHFRDGPAVVLAEHYRVLAPGGIAVISVPSLNAVRRIKRGCYFGTAALRPSLNNWLRHLTGRPSVRLNRRRRDGFHYEVNPCRGKFFEYWLSPPEFEAAVRAAGFTLLESRPTHHAVGLWGEFGEWAARNERRRFETTGPGRVLDSLLGRHGFVHNHMHTIVARR